MLKILQESGPNERKRSRAALTHPGQKSTLQKGKNKIKQRRENPRTVQSTEQQREIATEYQGKWKLSFFEDIYFLSQILKEYIESICSLESQLHFDCTSSFLMRARNVNKTKLLVTFPASPVPPLVPSPSARLPTPSHSKTEKNDDDCNSGDEYEKR